MKIRSVAAVSAWVVLMTSAARVDPAALQQAARSGGSAPAAQSVCDGWENCRSEALEAEADGEFERFHDLAWRTLQRRGRLDPDVMLMLARSQALSGRPHDSLVMLRRIIELGAAPSDALTGAAFERTRRLAGWPAVEQMIEQAAASTGAPAASAGVAVPPTPAGATPPGAAEAAPEPAARRDSTAAIPAPATPSVTASPRAAASPADGADAAPAAASFTPNEAVRFRAPHLLAAGLAYDGASGRFLFGNRTGRSVVTVSERLRSAADLVRSSSAGFQDVRAIAIDVRRGDLWVASSRDDRPEDDEGPRAVLHKLQLVSGRPLATMAVEDSDEAPRFSALAVDARGTVFALDAAGARLYRLAPGRDAPTLLTRLDVTEPVAMALNGTAQFAYVAHADGLSRVSLADGRVRAVGSPDAGLASIESVAWHRGTLVAVERAADVPRRLVRLHLNGAGTSVIRVETLDPEIPTCRGPGIVTVSGDEVYYLAGDPGERTAQDCTLIVRQLTLP